MKSSPTEMLATTSAPIGPAFSAAAAARASIGSATCSSELAGERCGADESLDISLLLQCRDLGGSSHLLVIGRDRRDFLLVEQLRDLGHLVGTVLAEAALPHSQFERDVRSVLAREVWNRRRLAYAARSMAIVAGLNPPLGAAHFRELLAQLDECRARLAPRQGRRVGRVIVGRHGGNVVRCQ